MACYNVFAGFFLRAQQEIVREADPHVAALQSAGLLPVGWAALTDVRCDHTRFLLHDRARGLEERGQGE